MTNQKKRDIIVIAQGSSPQVEILPDITAMLHKGFLISECGLFGDIHIEKIARL